MNTQHRFAADTSKFAYAQAFTRTAPAHHGQDHGQHTPQLRIRGARRPLAALLHRTGR